MSDYAELSDNTYICTDCGERIFPGTTAQHSVQCSGRDE